MSESEGNTLQERVERLEAEVSMLLKVVSKLNRDRQPDIGEVPPPEATPVEQSQKPTPEPVPVSRASPPPPPPVPSTPAFHQAPPDQLSSPPETQTFQFPEHMRKIEYWIARAGIGLVLFGVVFLFKYSIEQGWLTPWVRVGFGLTLGVALIVLGHRGSIRPFLRKLLLGGGIATFYITGFSAFQLLQLVSHGAAMIFMVAVTALTFALSLRQNEASLSLLGAIGGLGTPFMLYTDTGSLPGLIAYTCLVLTGTSSIYFFKGWRSLLWVSAIGGWWVFLIGLTKGLSLNQMEGLNERWWLQGGLVFGWLVFWALPVMREVLWAANPDRWQRPLLGFIDKQISDVAKGALSNHVHLLTIIAPLITLGMSMSTWPQVQSEIWGWIVLAATAVFWAIAWMLRRQDKIRSLAYTHALMGVLLLTISLSLLLDGNTLLFALSSEAALLHLLSRRLNARGVSISGNVLFVIVGLWLVMRLTEMEATQPAMFNAQALADLWVVAMASVIAATSRSFDTRQIYLIAGIAALAGLFIRELDSEILLLALAAEAVAVHLLARRYNDKALVLTG
ncbi:MAG: hypothetical protein DRP45_08235 [Candidatus Zixiibacteriota bacterium]|nr:MAG: hypothetical protein DRP45_08235 [candidate division Zixibacteria bacterium]